MIKGLTEEREREIERIFLRPMYLYAVKKRMTLFRIFNNIPLKGMHFIKFGLVCSILVFKIIIDMNQYKINEL